MAFIKSALAASLVACTISESSLQCIGDECGEAEILIQSHQAVLHIEDFAEDMGLNAGIKSSAVSWMPGASAWLVSSLLSAALLLFIRRFCNQSDEPLKKPRAEVVEAVPLRPVPPSAQVAEFHTAVREGRAELCQNMLDQKRRLVSERDAWSCTALHVAANYNAEAVARWLLQHGASPDAREAWDETPIFFAVRNGNVGTTEALIQAGADVNAANLDGVTPLVAAAKAGKAATCQLMLDSGASTKGLADAEMPSLLSALLVARIFDRPVQEE